MSSSDLWFALALTFVGATLAAMVILPVVGEAGARRRGSRGPALNTWAGLLKVMLPVLRRMTPVTRYWHLGRYEVWLTRMLQQAAIGQDIGLPHILALKLLLAAALPMLVGGCLPRGRHPALLALLATAGFFVVDRMLIAARRARHDRILRALPAVVDALALSVEAGLEFLVALRRVMERWSAGPLRDELTTVLNDVRLGCPRAAALRAFASRVDLAAVSSFVSVLIQADTLGAPITETLRAQADGLRGERFRRAEREGARASQRIILPLALLIFPAALIVIVGPVALSFIYAR